MTLEQLQTQINNLEQELTALKNSQQSETILNQKHYADEGKIFRRKHDHFLMGESISLGYDYSLGFKRIDKIDFYEQIPDPELGIEE